MDLRIQIRIHTKMSWIRNTACNNMRLFTDIFFLHSCSVMHHCILAQFWVDRSKCDLFPFSNIHTTKTKNLNKKCMPLLCNLNICAPHKITQSSQKRKRRYSLIVLSYHSSMREYLPHRPTSRQDIHMTKIHKVNNKRSGKQMSSSIIWLHFTFF